MASSFFWLKRIFPLVLGAGCGGQVGIGTLGAGIGGDGGAPSPSSSSGTIPTEAGTNSTPAADGSVVVPVSCGPMKQGPEGVYDLAANGDNDIDGFFGDGAKVYAGVNVIANFVAGRVFAFTPSSKEPVVDISPTYVRGLSPALGGVFYGNDKVSTGALGFSATGSGTKEELDLPNLPTFATHPTRAEAFFVAKTSGPTQDVVKKWAPPAAPTNAMVLPTQLQVRSLAVTPSDVVALVQDTTAFKPTHWIVHPNPLAGGGPYQELGFIDAEVVSNVVVDQTHAYVAVYDTSGTKAVFAVLRVSLTPSAVMPPPERIAQIIPTSTYGVKIEIDDSHVYVAMLGVPPTCAGVPCSQPATVKRVLKSAKPSTAIIEDVNAFEAASGHRVFNVDACYYYWYDAGQNILFRQSKGSL